ncbi:surface antigen BspA-like [Trichomonas vaginalis G3]|uniref:Surface antigen BspA-like n=1 Tax=Trichomonas vaginalis (strain ATCC PRA-98 / G3) TaxID=412133 RepID=A2DXU1_TRIV3|nr:amphoterin-induced protein family [Trichomonas vaginalis G3]EAY14801.1 surface antigen BspA-like [Trichomonas vaginalis G3]KAI5508075.1 amphoterin-induced protein family [Trichomonas vaginalis G3]|eukprot:XP_001327024.1 surface antigen BspA-like [Trichomonas vaginalis G3]
MFLDAFALSSNDSPKICMNFTHKTLFARYTIQRVTNISVSYMNIPNIVIDKNALITDSEQSTVYDWWGYNYNEIAIPKTVTKIRERVFENSTIYKINFEEGSQLSQIYNYAFMNCSKIYSFNFSSTSLSIIGMFSFKDCINLSRVIFPSTNFQIMNNVFENCINLTNVINITNISDSCFSGCYRLSNVEIREGSEIIGVRAFDHCNSLESINIPSSVKIISDYAFINCDKLKSINFTEINNLENFSINSISNCQSLSNISRFSSDKYICDYNTIYYKNNSDSKQYLIYHLSHSQDIVVFIKCNTICQYSFNHSNNIENISISNNSVSLIESFSFNKCLNLKYINFPLSVELVSRFAFNECKSIRCPILIENSTINYLKMINDSGIPLKVIVSCQVVRNTNKIEYLKRLYYHSVKFLYVC